MIWKNFVVPVALLCLWGLQKEGVQACTCFPIHPQELYCQRDVVVIKARVVGVMPDTQGESGSIKYAIWHLKTFKGVEKLFGAIYTGPNSAACGITLTKGVVYLFMGRLQFDGTLHVSLCDFYRPWDALSDAQKKVLDRYGEGCECTITPCFSFPCCMTSLMECLWTDFLPGKLRNGVLQAQNFACIKSSKGCCEWYRGDVRPGKPPRH
ncbi:metalloproteinase inhibitor 2-like [Festucalex cinctus]